ncbi:MAG: NAD(P)/FAD-dependent oxidoreductase [Archangium sp.]|nr:NAD(P)/FAD-dependent oxidoreductase [Archangium sp.]MDP3571902.1 NAD(P)/FAD-dependent oxidoreductase [Archangium sp.]
MKRSSIVVGAGAGGLFAALYLQQAGHDVMLLESKAHVGGCASAFSAKGFRFLSGATTLIGLEPEMPLGRVLAELEVPFAAPIAQKNISVWQRGEPLTLSRDTGANTEALTRAHGEHFAQFWNRSVQLGARGWGLITQLHFPPRGPGDLLGAARNPQAWGLLPALLQSTASKLGGGLISDAAKAMLDELLLVSTQARAANTPWLFGALGMEYLQRPLYLAEGGMASLLERLAEVFVRRGGTLKLETPVSAFARQGDGFRVQTREGVLDAEHLVLNLTHWDAKRLAAPELAGKFAGTVARHSDAWAACTLHLGVEDVFGDDVAPYHQLVLEQTLPVSGAHSAFVTLSRRDDRSMAPPGFRSVTMSCHAPARGWEGLSDAEHGQRKAAVGEELLSALAGPFPQVKSAAKPVVLPGTPKTWQGFTGRWGGRVGGLPFDFATLRRGYPTGRTGVRGLARVGDTVFPGQSVPACAWGARRVVGELLSGAASPRTRTAG